MRGWSLDGAPDQIKVYRQFDYEVTDHFGNTAPKRALAYQGPAIVQQASNLRSPVQTTESGGAVMRYVVKVPHLPKWPQFEFVAGDEIFVVDSRDKRLIGKTLRAGESYRQALSVYANVNAFLDGVEDYA
jgi:hypothetical protein